MKNLYYSLPDNVRELIDIKVTKMKHDELIKQMKEELRFHVVERYSGLVYAKLCECDSWGILDEIYLDAFFSGIGYTRGIGYKRTIERKHT